MSSTDYTQYAQIARSDFHSAIVQDTVPIDASFKGLPWLGIQGKSLIIPRLSPANGDFIILAKAITSGEDYNSPVEHFHDAINWTAKEFKLKTIAADRPVDDRVLRELSEPHLQEQFAIQVGTEAVIQRFNYLFINGNETSPEQFDGLNILCTGNTATSSVYGILADLDALISMISAGDGIPSAFIVPPDAEKAICFWAGGLGSASYGCMGFGPLDARMHQLFGQRLHYRGIPILRNDYISVVAGYTTMYAVQFGIGTGLAGIFPARNGEMGVRVERRHDTDADVWYYNIKLECGLSLYRQQAVASITNVSVAYPSF